MSDNEQKAQALCQEAEKKLNSSKGFLGNLFGYVSQLAYYKLSENYASKLFLHGIMFQLSTPSLDCPLKSRDSF